MFIYCTYRVRSVLNLRVLERGQELKELDL